MLVRKKENSKAVEMIAGLNELLRELLYGDPTVKWSLQEELLLVDKYIQLEQVRFDEEVEVIKTVDRNLLQVQVPKLLLQPIVENAFKHGFKSTEAAKKLSICAESINQSLRLTISNSGFAEHLLGRSTDGGIGLSNTVGRLRHFYHDRFSLKTEELSNGLCVTIEIPYGSD